VRLGRGRSFGSAQGVEGVPGVRGDIHELEGQREGARRPGARGEGPEGEITAHKIWEDFARMALVFSHNAPQHRFGGMAHAEQRRIFLGLEER